MTEPEKSVLGKIRDKIRPSHRIDESNSILRKEAGLIDVYKTRDLEQRRSEMLDFISEIEGKTISETIAKDVIDKTFRLFFLSGGPWYEGLDNTRLSIKAKNFYRLYTRYANRSAWTRTLLKCALICLHLSFNSESITYAPPLVVQTNPIIVPYSSRIDLSPQRGSQGNDRNEAPGPPRKHEQL